MVFTEASRFDVALLPGRSVRVCSAELRIGTHSQILVQTPLLRAGQARLFRVIWNLHMQNCVVLETDA